MPLQLLERLYGNAVTRADETAVREVATGGRRATFAQLASLVESFAGTVEASMAPGSVVAICLPNRLECTVAFLGALRARCTGFLITPSVSDHELAQAVEAARADAFVLTSYADRTIKHSTLRRLTLSCVPNEAVPPPSVRRLPADLDGSGLMLLSSGTTGDPKIVQRDGDSLDAVARNIADATGLVPGDRVLGIVPLCHSYGVEHGILAPTFAGCAVHLCQGFDTRSVLDQLSRDSITVFPGVPSVFEMLASLGGGSGSFPSLRCAYSAGSVLPPGVFEACRRRWGFRVGQLYGSSEVGSVTFNDPGLPGHEPLSVGWPMPGVVAVVVDPACGCPTSPLPPGVEGELAVHAPSMLRGYVGQDESPLVGGYFLTGDLARTDARGAITITGRTRLLIDVGALKVNPLEVEGVLSEHEGVRECVVMPMPVSDTVSRVRALVVPDDGGNPPSVESLRRFVRARLSAHKVPRVVELVDALPKSTTGKVLRRPIAS